jgi:hypothetical protein
MAKINLNELVKAINTVKAMDQQGAEEAMNAIYKQQPTLLGAALSLKDIGFEHRYIQVLLNILLVTHLSLEYSGLNIKPISQEEHKTQMAVYLKHISDVEKMPTPVQGAAMENYIDGHKENYLMAYVNRVMAEAGFAKMAPEKGKFLIIAGNNIVNSVAEAVAKL